MMIKIDVTRPDSHHFVASFPTEAQALVYVEARPDHTFREFEAGGEPITILRLREILWPTCHHGMSLDMCMDPDGPHHFGTREWEMAQYGTQ